MTALTGLIQHLRIYLSEVLTGMSKRILSVSYDVSLLATRQMLLQQKGYSVTSSLGFSKSIEHCRNGGFDLFVLGHSIPASDKIALIEAFRGNSSAAILSLERVGEEKVPSNFHVSPDNPEKFLRVVEEILAGGEERSQGRPA
jgi:DNA-binding NtrC family response regulator